MTLAYPRRSLRFGVVARPAWAWLALALFTTAAGAQTPNPGLVGLGNNAWVKLSPQPTSRYIPGANAGDWVLQTTSNPYGRAFSGTSGGGGHVFLYGGGHCTYQGNDVEIYDVSANRWRQSYKPEWRYCSGGMGCQGAAYGTDDGSGTKIASPLCRPQSEHTYQQVAYHPASGRMIGMFKSGTWAFDLGTNTWTPLAGPYSSPATFSPMFWTAFGLILIDTDRNRMVGFTLDGDPNGHSVYLFNFSTNAWTRIGSSPSGLVGDLYGTYVPGQAYFIVHDSNWAAPGTKTVWKYYLDTNTWTNITSSTPSEVVSGTGSWAWDSTNRVVIAIPHLKTGSDPVYVFTPATGTWTRVGVLPFTRSSGIADLQYDPINNVCFLVDFVSQTSYVETWAYRYRGGTLPADTSPPSATRDLRSQ